MRSRVAWLVVAVLFLPATAHAHGHTWDGSVGPGFGDGSVLWGLRGTLAVTLPPDNHDWSFLADLTNLKGTHAGEDVTQLSYMIGLRRFLNGTGEKHLISAHVLGGIVHRHQGAQDRTNIAVAYGLAYEWIPRGAPEGWAARVQAERAAVNDVKDFFQVSIGVVRRF